MTLLKDKKILLTGVLSNRSIAYGIAKACHREGAQLAFTYQNERFLDRITEFAKEFDSDIVIPRFLRRFIQRIFQNCFRYLCLFFPGDG